MSRGDNDFRPCACRCGGAGRPASFGKLVRRTKRKRDLPVRRASGGMPAMTARAMVNLAKSGSD
jgi:hypothetical protein